MLFLFAQDVRQGRQSVLLVGDVRKERSKHRKGLFQVCDRTHFDKFERKE